MLLIQSRKINRRLRLHRPDMCTGDRDYPSYHYVVSAYRVLYL
ncbi:hypothetical protein [Nostoc sp. UHCC 0302]